MPDQLSPEAAEAVHKAKNAAQAVEFAREAQAREQADMNKKALLDALKEVFGESDTENPTQMKILVRRIPILCTNISNMHAAIEKMEANNTWTMRAVVGGVITLGLLAISKIL